MEIPEEELKQPLVQNEVTPSPPQASGQLKSPPKRDIQSKEQLRPTFLQHATAMMRNPPEGGEDEEKDNGSHTVKKQQLPYAAPNVHPYAVPQYQPQIYGVGNGSGGWGGAQNRSYDNESIATIDIVFSGMYTLAAAFTIVQGFGMLIHFTYASIALGFYTMGFGALAILYDLKSIVNGVSVEVYFPFLGNYIGRSIAIFFFAVLCGQTYEYAGWTKFVVVYNLLVATLQGFVYFTTKTINAAEPHEMEDLPDL